MKQSLVIVFLFFFVLGVQAQSLLPHHSSLKIELIEPTARAYPNTDLIPVKVRVLDANQPVENAQVNIFWRQSFIVELEEKGNGLFEGEFFLPVPSLEKDSFEVVAGLDMGSFIKTGRKDFEVNLKKPVFEITPLTSRKHYAFGEPFDLNFGLVYPLKQGQIIYGMITVNNEFTKLFDTSKKIFTVHFTGQETLLMGRKPEFEVKLVDGHGNEVIETFELEQAGFEIWYIKQNIIAIAIILAFLLYVGYSEIKKGMVEPRKRKKSKH